MLSAFAMRSTSGCLIPSRMRALGFCVGVNSCAVHGRPVFNFSSRTRISSVGRLNRLGESPRCHRQVAFGRAPRNLHGGHIQRRRRHSRGRHPPAASTNRKRDDLFPTTRPRPSLVPGIGKSVLTVLDFIGQAHADYRFDIRYRALVGGTRSQIARSIEHGFPLMPPGCAIRMDEIAQEIVLNNLKAAIGNRRRAMLEDLRSLPRDVGLASFLEMSAFDLFDVLRATERGCHIHLGEACRGPRSGTRRARRGCVRQGHRPNCSMSTTRSASTYGVPG